MADTIIGFGFFLIGAIGLAWYIVDSEKRRAATTTCPECGRTYYNTDAKARMAWLIHHHCNHGVSL